ncbi:MAG: 4Fe-4S binding protein [Desulfovermiculus sp.]
MHIDSEKCIGCGFCVRDCPVGAVRLQEKMACIDHQACCNCGVCLRVCEQGAVVRDAHPPVEAVECTACPIRCQVRTGYLGACQRYRNTEGRLVRIAPVHTFTEVQDVVGPDSEEAIRRPLITGIGSGTTYPDCKPAPGIVHARQQGVEVVTVVTEAPLSYSSVMVKIDTDVPIGREGADVLVGRAVVGQVETEQYGSKMLHIGGVNRLTGPNGFLVAKTMVKLANKDRVRLKVQDGPRLQLQVGTPPIIDGLTITKMRVGCGSATLGIFAPALLQAADEAVVLDSHITGLLSEHAAGAFAGARPTGVHLVFRQSTPGRYFGDHGQGWGGTSIEEPADVIQRIDMDKAWPGMRILITETTGQNGAMFELGPGGELEPISLSQVAEDALQAISDTCESSRVSALYIGGAGGSARAGVTAQPIKLTRSVHENKAHLTVGGAPAYVLPGGGITFMVDVEKVINGFFTWTPTPATICPLEYTMRREEFEDMGGHVQVMQPFSASEPVRLPDKDEK